LPECLALLWSVDARKSDLVLLMVLIKYGDRVTVCHADDCTGECLGMSGDG
jgi:hypothetical protein